MPLTINLRKGARIELWKVLRLDRARGKHKRRRYLCLCTGCGKVKSVLADSLHQKVSLSCGGEGCRKKVNPNLGTITKASARKAWKEKAVIRDADSKIRYSFKKALAYLNKRFHVAEGTFLNWINAKKGGCPFLNGEAIDAQPGQGVFEREVNYYFKEDLDRIIRAWQKLPSVPKYSGLVYVNDACDNLKLSDGQLRVELEKIGAKIDKRLGKRKNGWPCKRAYITEGAF